MNNFLTDLRDFVNDRFSSPFWISTLVSWLLINWRVSITGLFNPELISIAFLEGYFQETPAWYHAFIPVIMGLSYSVLSGSLKELIEIVAKAVRSQLISFGYSGKLFKSMPIDEYNKKVNRLNRQVERIESEKMDTEEILSQNDELYKRIEEIDKRDEKLLTLIRTDILEGNLDDTLKKVRFLQKMHEINFGKILSDEDIPDTTDKTRQKETLKSMVDEERQTSPEIDLKPASISDKNEKYKEEIDNNSINNSIGKALRTFEHDDLSDPYSHKTLLLTLLLIKSKPNRSDKIDPSLLGLETSVLNKSIDNAIASGLLKKVGGRIVLSPEGAKKINELTSYLTDEKIVKILNNFYKKTKIDIMSALESRALTPEQVLSSVRFHPQSVEAINELINEKNITKQGNLLFHRSISP